MTRLDKCHRYRLVVTSGPTREWLDAVRFISNPSSGRMGWHIANEGICSFHFREVIYICGPVKKKYRSVRGAQNIAVETTAEMAQALYDQMEDSLLLIMAAAPGDYQAAQTANFKLKKSKDERPFSILFEPTIDILKSLIPIAARKRDLYRVGFAAETENIIHHGRQKLKEKQLDVICINRVYRDISGFGKNRSTLHLLSRDGGEISLGPDKKRILANRLLSYLTEQLLPNAPVD